MPDPTAPPRALPRTFAALAIPDYRRFYMGQGVSLIGTWLQDAAVSWIVFDVTRSERALGMVQAAGLLPGLAIGLFAGALAARVAPKALILATQLGQITGQIAEHKHAAGYPGTAAKLRVAASVFGTM